MVDYSNHSYKSLLQFIDDGCKQIGEDRDYVSYLLSMEDAESIEELIKIYNNVFKLLVNIHFGVGNAPKKWDMIETGGKEYRYRVIQLNTYLNENILKWYQRQGVFTHEQASLCLSNLRKSESTYVENAIVCSLSKDEQKNIANLISIAEYQDQMRTLVNTSYSDLDKHISAYKNYSKILAGHGRVFDAAELQFGKRLCIDYEVLAQQYKEEVELKIKREKEEKAREKEEKKKMIIYLAIKAILLIPIVGVGIYLFNLIGGPLGLFILIGLPGALISYLR